MTLRALAVVIAVVWPLGVLADPNDFRVATLGNPDQGEANFSASANPNFRAFAREMGAAITSINLMPPETLGHAAFAVNGEVSVVNISNRVTIPTERAFTGTLLIPSVHVRKGLPFSTEIGARVGWLDRSRMAVGTLEFKAALNEGFTYLPDVGVRGHFTRLFNTRDFDLYAAGFDIGVGKQFAIGGMVTLTPYVGWNQVYVGASSDTIDFRPERTLQEASANPQAQLQDAGSYEDLSLGGNAHARFYGGLRFIGGVVQLGLEYSYANLGTIKAPDEANPSEVVDRALPPVSAFNATFGLDF